MDEAGQKLRRARERLNLRVRDVEMASQRISQKYHNPEFTVLINRLSEIENKGLGPSIYKLYALSAIYRLDFAVALEWYGIDLPALPSDSLFAEGSRTHPAAYHPPPHPACGETPIILSWLSDVDVVGEVVGVAMLLDQGRRRRERS